MKRISNSEYAVVDKNAKTIQLWHDCQKFRGKENAAGRAELEQKKDKDGMAVYVCPFCGYKHTHQIDMFEHLFLK